MSAFTQAFAIVVGHEGGFDANPDDPGNWTGGRVGAGQCAGTKYGISAASYPNTNISDLSELDAAAIYQRDFWGAVSGDQLPPPLALLVFDAAVNCGVSRAVRWLQSACGAVPDGDLGPATLAAVHAASSPSSALCAEFNAERLSFMSGLASWRLFGRGWARRLCVLPYQSITMTEQ